MIPEFSSGKKVNQSVQERFAGLDCRLSASDGSIADMLNMSGDDFPFIGSRSPRKTELSASAASAAVTYCGNGEIVGNVIFADGNKLYYKNANGAKTDLATLNDSTAKILCRIGDYIIIMPDKLIYDTRNQSTTSLEATWSGTADFANGTYASVAANRCRIVTAGNTPFPFMVGDAVTISGAANTENNITIIVREISADGKSLGFYENSFTNASGQSLTISRTAPTLTTMFEHDNRIFGTSGNTIYVSQAAYPFNFNVFDGLASDSYAVSVGSSDAFTGGVAYLGYPTFFKDNRIYKLYGSYPSEYKVMDSANSGVAKGAGKSLAIAGERLYYLSDMGIMEYSGGMPVCISEQLGKLKFSGAVGGSDGRRYYVSMSDGTQYRLYCYDTQSNQWYAEDDVQAVGFATVSGHFYCLTATELFELHPDTAMESAFDSAVTFAPFEGNSVGTKHIVRIMLYIDADNSTRITVSVAYDNGRFSRVRTVTGRNDAVYMPIPVRRCRSFRIKIEATGRWILKKVIREYTVGGSR